MEKLEKYYKDEDREVKISPDLEDDVFSETSETSQISEIEEEILDELTSIERFGLGQLHLKIAPGLSQSQPSSSSIVLRPDYLHPTEVGYNRNVFLSQRD